MKSIEKIFCAGLFALASALPGIGQADEQQLQIGYVFDAWNSNSYFSGTEHRIPLSYSLATPNFGLRLSTAFVVGDYKDSFDSVTPEFNSGSLSDSTLGANFDLDMGNSMKSSFVGSLNIPTGDTTWEAKAEDGSIPYIFEPSFYHGRGLGGNFFYTLDASSAGSELGLGLGYMATSTYDTGISDEGTYYPGDTVAAIGTVGFKMSTSETWGFRLVHTFPLEAKNADPADNFTAGESSILTSQWVSKMGKDKLVLNFSYSLYDKGNTGDPLVEDPGAYFGDRLEIHPIFGYIVGKDTSMETGLIWEDIFQNGYPVEDTADYEGGGNLFGVEQSVTFQLDPGTFWNFAGLYHFIANANAGIGQQEIDYQRFTLGTNVGIKW